MSGETLFDRLEEFKEKLDNFVVHKKKLYALNNYSEVVPFQHKDYLILIKRCMADGFLGEREADFLCYMLEKYKLDFLEWSHRTPWLKKEMSRLAANYVTEKPAVATQTLFDFAKIAHEKASLPFDLMAQKHKEFMLKRA